MQIAPCDPVAPLSASGTIFLIREDQMSHEYEMFEKVIKQSRDDVSQ